MSIQTNRFLRTYIWLLLSIVMVTGCSQDETKLIKTGSISFSLSPKAQTNGRVADTGTPAAVLLSIKDADGNLVYENKKLSLFTFGQGYMSESVQMKVVGSATDYTLVTFLVLDANGKTLYASPSVGSPKAQFVSKPLPLTFTISENDNAAMVPEVIAVEDTDTPESFGYASFGFEVVDLFEINMPIYQITDKPDSMVAIATNGTAKVIGQFTIQDTCAKVILKGLKGAYDIEVRTFIKDNSSITTWYGKPMWQDPADQNNAATARISSRYFTTVNSTSGHLLKIPSYLDKTSWKDFYFNSLKKGIGLFFSQDPWESTFLEVDVPDALSISYLHVDKEIYWLNKQGSSYQDQGLTKWDYCNDANICSAPLTGKNTYKFSISKTSLLNEISCHQTLVYITCDKGKPTEFSDYKDMTFCTDKN